jgi:hypothetical protein
MRSLLFVLLLIASPFASAYTATTGVQTFVNPQNHAFELRLEAGGTGTYLSSLGKSPVTWDQVYKTVVIVPTGTLQFWEFPIVNHNGKEMQVEATYTAKKITLSSNPVRAVTETIDFEVVYNFYDGSPEETKYETRSTHGYWPGRTFALIPIQLYGYETLLLPDVYSDNVIEVQLKKDGTGTVVSQGSTSNLTDFIWSISLDNSLVLSFPNVGQVWYYVTGNGNYTLQVVAIAQLAGAERTLRSGNLTAKSAAALPLLTDADFAGSTYEFSFLTSGEGDGTDIIFNADHTANMKSNYSQFADLIFQWAVTADGSLTLTNYREFRGDGTKAPGSTITDREKHLACVAAPDTCYPATVRTMTPYTKVGDGYSMKRNFAYWQYDWEKNESTQQSNLQEITIVKK